VAIADTVFIGRQLRHPSLLAGCLALPASLYNVSESVAIGLLGQPKIGCRHVYPFGFKGLVAFADRLRLQFKAIWRYRSAGVMRAPYVKRHTAIHARDLEFQTKTKNLPVLTRRCRFAYQPLRILKPELDSACSSVSALADQTCEEHARRASTVVGLARGVRDYRGESSAPLRGLPHCRCEGTSGRHRDHTADQTLLIARPPEAQSL
jgi:hypothetical protein